MIEVNTPLIGNICVMVRRCSSFTICFASTKYPTGGKKPHLTVTRKFLIWLVMHTVRKRSSHPFRELPIENRYSADFVIEHTISSQWIYRDALWLHNFGKNVFNLPPSSPKE